MPRKKSKPTVRAKAKNTTKGTAKMMGLTLIDAMEKEFNNTPKKVIALCNKELSALKQKEKKLKGNLNKAQAQQKAAKSKQMNIAAKATPAAKKQLNMMKKMSNELNKVVAHLSAEIEQINGWCKSLTQKQAKYLAISKQLLTIEKQSLKSPKKMTSPKKSARKLKVDARTPLMNDVMTTPSEDMPLTISNVEPVESVEIS